VGVGRGSSSIALAARYPAIRTIRFLNVRRFRAHSMKSLPLAASALLAKDRAFFGVHPDLIGRNNVGRLLSGQGTSIRFGRSIETIDCEDSRRFWD
jgi:hypothetical protein